MDWSVQQTCEQQDHTGWFTVANFPCLTQGSLADIFKGEAIHSSGLLLPFWVPHFFFFYSVGFTILPTVPCLSCAIANRLWTAGQLDPINLRPV